MTSDDQLLVAWQQGDKRAGKQLFERHYAAIHRFFKNKVGPDAPDLAQRTFLGCIEGVERYRGDRDFRSWLFAIAYRQLCKHYRSKATERARFDFGSVTAHDLDPTPSTMFAKSREERLLLEGLRLIPVDMQVALELHYWEKMSDANIAKALELPLGTVKSRIRRARFALQEQLSKLSNSPQQLESTLANLDMWANEMREVARKD